MTELAKAEKSPNRFFWAFNIAGFPQIALRVEDG